MSGEDTRARGARGPKGFRRNSSREFEHVRLREMRFDTPELSNMFLNLRYLNPVFAGVRDDAIRLPPIDESVSSTSSSGGMVYKAFPHGLMYGDQMSLMAGGGLFLGCIIAFLLSLHLIIGGNSIIFEYFDAISQGDTFTAIALSGMGLFLLAISPFLIVMIGGDLFGFRFETSALFDRNSGTIHLFSDDSMPWAPWRYKLKTYDWRCVRGEIDTVTLVTGPLVRREAGLRCVVMDRPNGKTVVDQFVLGINMPAQHIQPLLDTWEHVRRFMQHEGPLFADQDDQPNCSLGRQPLWKHLLAGPKFEFESTLDMIRIAKEEKSMNAAMASVLGIILLPFFWIPMLWGVLPWISGLAKRDPTWPAEIIASVGGASLQGKSLEAWRGVRSEPGSAVCNVASDDRSQDKPSGAGN